MTTLIILILVLVIALVAYFAVKLNSTASVDVRLANHTPAKKNAYIGDKATPSSLRDTIREE